jgi:hypothetical protein
MADSTIIASPTVGGGGGGGSTTPGGGGGGGASTLPTSGNYPSFLTFSLSLFCFIFGSMGIYHYYSLFFTSRRVLNLHIHVVD